MTTRIKVVAKSDVATVRGRLSEDERGFTLPEMMVTILIMIVVLFALYNIFDMSIRVFSFGNDKLEATENARIGLERMERELRAAYPQSPSDDTLLTAWNDTQVTFVNELGVEEDAITADEAIGYSYAQLAGDDELRRTQNGSTQVVAAPLSPTPVPVGSPASTQPGLDFDYFQEDGVTEVLPGGNEDDVAVVKILLTIDVGESTETLTTDVNLRNRT